MSDFNSSLPVRTQNSGDVVAKIADATLPSQQLAVDSSGRVTAKIQASNGDNLTDTAGSLNVNVTNTTVPTDIEKIVGLAPSATNALPVELTDGTAFISRTNPLPVYIQDGGTSVNNYNTTASVVAGATSNHDYTVTAGKTLHLSQIRSAASGKLKIEVQIETGVATSVFNSVFVGFNSTANPNIDISLTAQIEVAAGVRVRVIRTNNDNQSEDVYSTICGHEQ